MSEEYQAIEDAEFIETVHSRFSQAKDKSGDWRDEARRAYSYVANDQWEDEDVAILEEELRPIITFNRTEVFVQAVTGLEAINRQEVRFIPRKPGPINTSVADILTAAAEYVNDDADAETHHSAAFRDLVICGMGWTELSMDYEMNPDGDIRIDRRDPEMMYWDPRSEQRNLSDARWVMRIKPMSYTEVKERWPNKLYEIYHSRIFDPDYEQQKAHDAQNAWKYAEDQSEHAPMEGKEVWVAQYQWYEREYFYRVMTPQGVKEFPSRVWDKFKDAYPAADNMKAVRIPRRTYRQAMIAGYAVLEKSDLVSDAFTFQCMTGKHDHNNNIWYGLLRPLFDPQDWVNKLFSQILHIVNSNAKGGLIAEKDAFDNVQEAESNWSRADRITWLKSGALQKGKIQEKQAATYPVGLDRLLQFAMSMFQDVTGASMELLGLAEKVQPGVLEAQRKQAGITILSWAFESLKAYRRHHGRILSTYIREFIADERLIRFVGQDGTPQYIPLVRDEMAAKYDIIVDESPQSPNEREKTFTVLSQLLPMLIDMGIRPPIETLDYLPLPASLIEKWKQQMRNPEAEQKQQMVESMEMQDKAAKTRETQSKTELNHAKAQAEVIKAITK